jgi:hypothetical protein
LIEDKVDDLEDLKARVEAKLFRLTLITSKGERVNPSNAYLDWLAVSFFRQWLVENTTPPPVPVIKNIPQRSPGNNNHPEQGATVSIPSGRIYHLLGSASTQAYLSHDELKPFLKLHKPRFALYARKPEVL